MNRKNLTQLVLPLVLLGVVVTAIALSIQTGSSTPRASPAAESAVEFAQQLQITVDKYFGLRGNRPDTWWLESPEGKSGPELVVLLEQKKSQIEQVLKKYRSTNQLSEKVAEHFPTFFVSIMTSGGESMAISKDGGVPQGVEICFVPRRAYNSRNMASSIFWDPHWRAMKITGIEWPETFLPAVLYHELGHGLSQSLNQASATAAPSSDLYKGEEIQMHRLELAVLDQACGGAYIKAIDQIVRRHKAKDWYSLVAKLEPEDLIELDRVAGTERCGAIASQVVVAQHLLSLGLRAIDIGDSTQKYPSKKGQDERALYTFLTELFGK